MDKIEIFKNAEFGSLRTVVIDNEPWFVGKDVAEALGYSDTFGSLKKHVDEDDKQNCQNDSFESPRGMTVINESGVYSLVFGSKLPSAKKFKRWVTSEVLPQIRKTGSYQKPMTQLEILAQAAQQLVEQEHRITAVERRMDGIHDVIALSANGWRQDSANLINRIAAELGGSEHIQPVRRDSYKFLNERMHVDLAARLRNKKRKAAEAGMSKSRRDKMNYLDVIGDDPKLIEGYTIVVKDMAIKYGVTEKMN